MDGLRWLLLIFGALVVAGVYFYTRRERQNPPDESAASPRITPTLNDAAVEEECPEDSVEPVESEEMSRTRRKTAPRFHRR